MSGFQRSIMMGMAGGFDIITASNAENINLRTLLDAAGFNNDVPTTITYTLNASINVTSAASTGTATPAWQTGTIGSIHTVLIYINGAVKGYGGAGGAGGGFNANGSAGATGGTSMSFACDATLVVNSGGSVLAGGGGGGGGGGDSDECDEDVAQAAGGNGGLGAGTAPAANGATSTPDINGCAEAVGGSGGNGGAHGASGSAGGAGGQSGGAGGAGGYAVAKNSNTVTTTNNGTISGTQG
jgi:hypothetical protein